MCAESAVVGRCYACGEAEDQRRIGVNRVFVCRRCGMGRVPGVPMTEAYWTNRDSEALRAEGYWAARRRMFETALRRLAPTAGAGRVLDVGGGVGHFTEVALGLGWDAYSADLSPLAVGAAASRIGSDRSLSAPLPDELAGSFDLVTLWCVVAHVADPTAVIAEAVRFLRPAGALLLTTPNFLFQAPYARLLARVGHPLDFRQADHLLNFTPAALERVARAAGLDDLSYHYFGVTEECVVQRSLGRVLVPLKRAWNFVGLRTTSLGLPPLGAELQLIGHREGSR